MQRQLIHAVDEADLAWLKAAADADGTSVGEIVRRCIAYAREMAEAAASVLDEPSVQQYVAESPPEPDYSDEPRAEEIDIPADPDEDASLIRSPPVLQQRPKPATFRPLPSLMDTVAAVPTPIAGQATRPVGANPERLASGDVRGRVQLQNLQRQKFVGFGG